MPYHCRIDFKPPLPDWMQSEGVWVKGDMIVAVGFHRLDFIRIGKATDGRRAYYYSTLDDDAIKAVRTTILNGLGLGILTKHL